MTEDVETRLAALEAERAIRELLARFSFLEDCGHIAEWVQLWTEDGVYDLDGHRVVGRRQLQELMDDPAGNRRPEFFRHCMHTHSGTLQVRVDGDTGVALGYTVLHQASGAAVVPVSAAANRWTLRRVGGRWMVAARVRRQIGAAGFVDALADDAGVPQAGDGGGIQPQQ